VPPPSSAALPLPPAREFAERIEGASSMVIAQGCFPFQENRYTRKFLILLKSATERESAHHQRIVRRSAALTVPTRHAHDLQRIFGVTALAQRAQSESRTLNSIAVVAGGRRNRAARTSLLGNGEHAPISSGSAPKPPPLGSSTPRFISCGSKVCFTKLALRAE